MYCPKCAAENNDDTKFCRACGTNLSLVPQAIAGRLPDPDSTEIQICTHQHSRPSIASGITKIFMGAAFLIIAIGAWFSGYGGWGLLTLIPAFGLLGSGVADIVSAKYEQNRLPGNAAIPEARLTNELTLQSFSETLPPSVTEHTTRQLDRETGRAQNEL